MNLGLLPATLHPKQVAGYAWREQLGDAELFTRIVGDTICYDPGQGKWCLFDTPQRPGHWSLDVAGRIVVRVAETLGEAYSQSLLYYQRELNECKEKIQGVASPTSITAAAEAKGCETQVRRLASSIKRLGVSRYINGVLQFAQSMLAISGKEWDKNQLVIGVTNGVVELHTGTLRKAKPSDYIRRIAPTEYDEEAKAPRFDKFISEILHDDSEMVAYVQRLFGYAIAGLDTEHVFPLLYGDKGRNGKDTLVKIFMNVLGAELCKPVSRDLVISTPRRPSGPTPELYDLWGARIVWVDESNESDSINAGQLKALSGGSVISCRQLQGHQISFWPTHTIFLLTNHKPRAASNDHAFWARVRLIPFDVRFVDDPRLPGEKQIDRDLLKKLEQERTGILRWLVEGHMEWQREGMHAPDVVTSATHSYRYEHDSFELWVRSSCEFASERSEMFRSLYASYLQWCNDKDFPPISERPFTRRLKDQGLRSVHKQNGAWYEGIYILKPAPTLSHSMLLAPCRSR